MDVILTSHVGSLNQGFKIRFTYLRKHIESGRFGGLVLNGLVDSLGSRAGFGGIALFPRNAPGLGYAVRSFRLITAIIPHCF
jgi:hypothetical protein